MRSVLIVTPFFAPQSHAAVFRAHKLAKYLPEHGWKPYVLTVDTNYTYNEDPGLLEELPEAVEITRARYIEPTPRGLRMAFGGEDRTFAALKPPSRAVASPAAPCQQAPGTAPARGSKLMSRGYGYLRQRWLTAPDAYWSWERVAIRAGKSLIAEHGIDIVYTTALPYTAHRIGRALQRARGARWVADFRDPAGYGRKFVSGDASVAGRQQDIVREALRHADIVTTLSSSYALVFRDLYGDVTRAPIRFIPTGVDDALIPDGADARSASAEADPYLIFVGEIMADYGHEFFRYFAQASRHARREWRIRVIGHEQLNRMWLRSALAANDLVGKIEFIDHLPQRELYRHIAGAQAAILAPGPHSHWWTNHAKLVDYAGMRKPVLAVVPEPSEARSVLTKTRLGIFLDGDPDRATAVLASFLNGELPPPKPVAEECDRYLASSQVSSFASLFDEVVR